MSIPDYRLPEGIERGSQYGPSWSNVIQIAIAGNEQRFGQWTRSRSVGNLSYGLLNSSNPVGDYRAILSLFYAHNGSLYPFRFRNWSDYQATDENFGTGDGSTLSFQLTKTYDPSLILLNTPGDLQYVRDIILVSGSPVIKVDSVTKTVTTDYTISSAGVVTFTSAPANGKAITWTGEHDDAVRFDTEQLPITMNESDIIAITNIPIKEVVGES